jgi:hypothetical protein
MPENVRVEELPGLLKRYKDGVPGWELKATDLDSVIDGRGVVPRDELLARVKQRSPVYTHKEVVLTDNPPNRQVYHYDITDPAGDVVSPARYGDMPYYQDEASPLGRGWAHGDTKYADYSQDGDDYTEILLTQPGARSGEYGNHWRGASTSYTDAAEDAVAHARFDTHGDALRINELQSDLGIHNRKAREAANQLDGQLAIPDNYALAGTELPFPIEDAWSDLLIKRLALEAAQKGHRAIEVASPRAIADKVGGNIDNYEHLYGKVVPGALERLGRRMGGLTEDVWSVPQPTVNDSAAIKSSIADSQKAASESIWRMRRKAPGMGEDLLQDEYDEIYRRMVLMRSAGHDDAALDKALMSNYEDAYKAGVRSLTGGNMPLPSARKQAGLTVNELIARAKAQSAMEASLPAFRPSVAPGRRYIMSDEMRRRILTEGIPAAVAAGMVSDELIERLGEQQ